MSVDASGNEAATNISVQIGPVGVINSLGWKHEKVFANYLGCLPNFTRLEVGIEQQTLLAKVDTETLEPLPAEYENLAMSYREQRMLRLAMMALNECVSQLNLENSCPLFLSLPDLEEVPCTKDFPEMLATLSDNSIDASRSRLFHGGRAAGISALDAAVNAITSGQVPQAIVGGVDSLTTEKTLDELMQAQRLVINSHFDAIIPGEAAIFLQLEALSDGEKKQPLVRATQVSRQSDDPINEEDHLPAGLAEVIARIRQSTGEEAQPRTLFPPFNGESRWIEEWGECQLKNTPFISAKARFEMPSCFCGDMGAAHALFSVALCADQLIMGLMQGPVLICAASDQFLRGAAIIDSARTRRVAA